MNVDLTKEDIIELQQHTENYINNKYSNKRNLAGQLKNTTEECKHIVFPTFDLSTKIIGFGNWSNRVTTIAYEIKYHPVDSTLLKYLLIKSSVLDIIPPSDFNFHFILHGLIHSTDTTAVKNQLIQQNRFLAQIGIVPILNIPDKTMNSVLKIRLLTIPSVVGLDPTYLTESSGKWSVVVKTIRKNQTQREIDSIINNTFFPEFQTETAGRSNRYNINTSLVIYTAVLQK